MTALLIWSSLELSNILGQIVGQLVNATGADNRCIQPSRPQVQRAYTVTSVAWPPRFSALVPCQTASSVSFSASARRSQRSGCGQEAAAITVEGFTVVAASV
jgi:hypothetical protein